MTEAEKEMLKVIHMYDGIADNGNIMAETGWDKSRVLSVGEGLIREGIVAYSSTDDVSEEGVWETPKRQVMTKSEIIDWMRNANPVDFQVEFDWGGNEWRTEIFEKDGQLFSVRLCNGSPCQKNGDYAPIKVRIVERVSYEPL